MQVSLYATLRPIVGAPTVEVHVADDATVLELAHELVRRWPDLRAHVLTDEGALSRGVNVYVDGRGSRWLPHGNDTVLTGVDRVDVFPPVAGG